MQNIDTPPAPLPPGVRQRRAREAAALRENLRRRKQQDRARGAADREPPMPDADLDAPASFVLRAGCDTV